jgi:aflatoxin B1 aldehyde reductase
MLIVDIFYIHAPDTSVPLADWLPGVQEVYKSGVFSRFGLSNFQADNVQEVYDHCKENGYVLPTVYQGNYSAVARKQDTLLFPLLRKLGISFYAYSPIAGGFLTKTKQQIEEGAGRFDQSTFIGQSEFSSVGFLPCVM